MTGVCKYCGQIGMDSEADLKEYAHVFDGDVTPDEQKLDYVATKKCKCAQAESERRRETKIEAAGAWIENYFQDRPEAADTMKKIVDAITRGVFGRISIKEGKRNYTVDLDSDECIRIRTKFTDTNEETF